MSPRALVLLPLTVGILIGAGYLYGRSLPSEWVLEEALDVAAPAHRIYELTHRTANWEGWAAAPGSSTRSGPGAGVGARIAIQIEGDVLRLRITESSSTADRFRVTYVNEDAPGIRGQVIARPVSPRRAAVELRRLIDAPHPFERLHLRLIGAGLLQRLLAREAENLRAHAERPAPEER